MRFSDCNCESACIDSIGGVKSDFILYGKIPALYENCPELWERICREYMSKAAHGDSINIIRDAGGPLAWCKTDDIVIGGDMYSVWMSIISDADDPLGIIKYIRDKIVKYYGYEIHPYVTTICGKDDTLHYFVIELH